MQENRGNKYTIVSGIMERVGRDATLVMIIASAVNIVDRCKRKNDGIEHNLRCNRHSAGPFPQIGT